LLAFTEFLTVVAEPEEPPRYEPAAGTSTASTSDFVRRVRVSEASTKASLPNFEEMRLQRRKSFATKLNRGPVFTNQTFTTNLADTIFVGANVLDKENKMMKDMTALPVQGLCRFQLLEAFVRSAIDRYVKTGEKESPADAVEELMTVLNVGADQLYLRSTLQKALFVEECCLVFRQGRKILEEAFFAYSKRLKYPGRGGIKSLTYGAWLEFAQACKADQFGVSMLNYGIAFALGKEKRIDEYKSMRHMELNWTEFLVSVGALCRLNGDFDPDFFSDTIQDFIELHVTQAVAAAGATPTAARFSVDPILSQMVSLAGEVFLEADKDNSGFLTYQEFSNVLRQKKTIESFKELDIMIGDFKVLFKRLDVDNSGTVTLDELCDGLVKMKKALMGLERAVVFLRKVFEEADLDGSGSVTKDEFYTLFDSPQVQAKMVSIGIPSDEIDDLWASIDAQDADEVDGVTTEEMIQGFLMLKEDDGPLMRGVNFMRQVFKIADLDEDGKLTREEVSEAFYADQVNEKLDKLDLFRPDWLDIFDAMDINQDSELSWDELQRGIINIWRKAMQ